MHHRVDRNKDRLRRKHDQDNNPNTQMLNMQSVLQREHKNRALRDLTGTPLAECAQTYDFQHSFHFVLHRNLLFGIRIDNSLGLEIVFGFGRTQ
jgi:hypothetical protein